MSAKDILQIDYVEQMDEVGITRPTNPDGFQELLYETAAIHWGQEYPPDRPPEYLYHVDQVDSVASNIVGTSILADDIATVTRTHELAFTHDIGRAFHFGKYHPIVGARMLDHMGFDGATQYAVDHHRMGLGLPILGERSLATVALDYENGRSDTDPVMIFHERYGLAGCAVLLADSSKSHDPRGNPNLSHIEPFSEELFQQLMERQFKLHEGDRSKGYAPGSLRHQTEIAGRNMLLRMIDFMGDQYRVDYMRAVEQAQQDASAREAQIAERWERMTDRQLLLAA